ncbi:MAG: integral rane protease transrane protein [Frankiales bacterium]|nr:integral rane protease transrane protein [Frankiales bacterium]
MKLPALALLGCLIAVVVTVLLTVPFPVLPGAHPHVDVLRDFTPAQIARERAFHAAVRPPAYLSLVVGIVVAAVLGLTGLGARVVGGIPGHWTVKAVVGTALVLALGQLLTLPFDVQAERVLRRYGLSTQDWTGWTNDLVRGLGIKLATTAFVVVVVLALVRRFPTTWWAWGALATSLLIVAGSFAYPLVVEPAFNRFTSLPAGQLRTDLLGLATRDHVPVKDVLVADASRRTTALNAYVSGFGSTRRIVVYDTLLRRASPGEVELIVAHELGHAKQQDVLHGTIMGAFGGAAGICGLYLLLSWSPLLRRAGVTGAADPRVVPLVLFLGAITPLLVTPLTNLVSRHIEARADVHSLDLTGDVATFVASEKRLATTNLSDLQPNPIVYALFFTHPSEPERIALAREWERLHQ